MRILWDEPKRQNNLAGRGLDFADLSEDFFVDALVVPAGNGRYKAIGRAGERQLTLIFRPLGCEALSVTSMRRASNIESQLL